MLIASTPFELGANVEKMADREIKPKRGLALSALNKKDEVRSISLAFGDAGELEITYTRSKYTAKFEREIRELVDENLPAGMLARMVFTLLVDWNVEDVVNPEADESEWKWEKVPLVIETFEALVSAEALETIVELIGGDNRPNPNTSGSTKDTF